MRPRSLRRVRRLFTPAFILFLCLAALIAVGALASGGRARVKYGRQAENKESAAHANAGAMFAPPIGSTITVNSTEDSATAGDGKCTLREAINNANSNSDTTGNDCVAGSGADTINFSVSLPATITLSSALPNITDDLTISGPGASQLTVSGNGSVRVFNVTASGTVTISGLIISNGNASSQNGGGIQNGSGTLNVSNSTFSSNSAQHGGAISNESSTGTVSVSNCIFSNNSVQNRGAGIYNTTGTLNVTGSTFTGGIAGTGGGIYSGDISSGSGTANVTNSTFSNNQSVFNPGGGIRNFGTLNITNSTFSGNSTGARGGALSHTSINGSVMTVTNCTISGNSADLGGGGIESAFGTTRIRNSIVALNTGGSSPDILIDFGGTVTSLGHNVVGNTAGSGLTGAPQTGDFFDGAVTPFYLGPLQNNGGPTKTMIPGGVAVEGGDDCVADALHCSDSSISQLTTDQRGFQRKLGGHVDIGAVEVIPVNTLADHDDGTCGSDCTLREAINVANANPGSTIGFSVTGTIPLSSALPNISSNMAIAGIGADKLEVQGSQTLNNSFRVFNVTGGTVTISGLTADNGSEANGGGINNSATLVLQDCAIGTPSSPSTNGTVTNIATFAGGGISNSGTLTIERCTVSNNVATSLGGGIYNAPTGNLTVKNSTISSNTSQAGSGTGGGIRNDGLTVTLVNVTVSGNAFGGLSSNLGTFNLSNTLVAANLTSSDADIGGTYNSNDYNLIGNKDAAVITGTTTHDQIGTSSSPIDAKLRPFFNYGGTTYTYMLKPASPAVNAGNNTAATSAGLTTDQRGTGFSRINNTTVDIGAVETNYTITVTQGNNQTTLIGTAFGTPLQVVVKESNVIQAGIDVTFQAPSTGASGTFQGAGTTKTVQTDANGLATAPAFTANNTGGSYAVTASAGILSTTFSLDNITTPTITADTNGTGTQDQACPEQPLTLHANSAGATSYQWYSNGNIINGETSQTLQVTSAATYTVTASSNGYTTQQSAGYVVQDPTPQKPSITAGGPTTFCQGGSVTLTASNGAGIQWYKDGAAIPGANGINYVANASGSYTAQLNGLGCHSAISDAVVVTVNPIPSTPTINASGPTTFAAGGSVTLSSSSATGNQWYKDGSPISGETNQTYNATASGSYTVVVTTSGCSSATSAATTVTVVPAPTLGNYLDTTVALGASTTVTPNAPPANATTVGVSTSTNFKGTLTVDSTTGAVRVTNASTAGAYTVTVKAFNSLGVSTTKSFTLTVSAGTACAGASVFTNQPDVSVGNNPQRVVVGDFNNDGKQDIATVNSNSNSVSIRLGNGSGGFSGTTEVSNIFGPQSVAVGDFNGDGKLDLAIAHPHVVNTGSDSVSIRLGDGSGGFSGTTEVSVGRDSRSVAVGDFNNDGKLDLAVANGGSNTVSIRLGDGSGGFSGTTEVSVGTTPQSVAIGDFNNDGKLDIATANFNANTVSIRLGDGSGGFTGTTEVGVGTTPVLVVVGDFNSDGKQDIATVNRDSNTVSIRLGDGSGGFTGTTEVSVGDFPVWVAVGDFNNDGKLDLAVDNQFSSNVSILIGDGAGGFTATTNVSVGSNPFSVAIGDFNGDGKQDLAVANASDNNVSIRLGKCDLPPTITAATGLSRQQGSPSANSQIATVTDDGGNGNVTVKVNNLTSATVNGVTLSNIVNTNGTITADIVADCSASPALNASFTLQASDGLSTTTATLNVTVTANTAPVLTYSNPPAINFGGSLAINPATGPSDNVSVSSIVVVPGGTYTGTINVNSSTGVVSISNAAPAGTHTITIRATDSCGATTDATFTLDVRPLATLGNYPNTTVALGADTTVMPNAPPANATSVSVSTSTNFKGTLTINQTTGVVRVTNASTPGAYTITVKALNSLGVSTTKTFTLTVQTGTFCNGAPTFTNGTNFPANNGPRSVAIGDFNGDGKQDLAVANFNPNTVSILLGDGNGRFSTASDVSVGSSPISVAVGDFNNDGKQDLAVANQNSNNVSIRLGDGTGGFTGTTNIFVGTNPTSVAVGDFNGDGKQDLAVANLSDNTVSIRLGDGAGGFTVAPNVSVGVTPNFVVVGDFNGDGKQDLATANDISNSVSIRLGDGAGNFSGTTNISVGITPESIAIGDFNGDGKQDLAVANFNSNTVSILLGDGAGGFSRITNVAAGNNPSSVAIGDFNGDGRQDLAVTNQLSSTVAIRLGDGAGGFTSTTNASVRANPVSIAVGDFNGDGKQDLAVANFGSGDVSIRLGGCNPAPTITAATGLSRQQGSLASNSTIATVTDDGGNGNVTVTVNNSTSATVNDVTVSNIVNSGGTITANIAAACGASDANFTLQASDGASITTATLSVTVTANTAPVLTYTTPQSVSFNGSLTVTPTSASDNGSSIYQVLPGHGLTTAPTVNSSGVVSITNAQPAGAHTITIRATDNCFLTTDSSFTLNVAKAGTTTAVASSINPSASGQSVTFTATVTSSAGTPTGTVTFKDNGNAISTCANVALSGGQAACTTSGLTVGLHTITADYSGDTNFATSTGTLAGGQQVNPFISINDVSLAEGDAGTKSFNFTVTLSAASNLTVKVDFATANGTATAGSDYVATSGTLTFNPGDTQKTITVTVNGDTSNEPDETFFVNLTNPQNASISKAQGTGTILNDDASSIQLSASSYSGNESAGNIPVTVNRTGDLSQPASVDYATSDTAGLAPCSTANGIASQRCDYAITVGTLRFAAGENSKTIFIPVIDDSYTEGPETFTITLSNAVGAGLGSPASATITINDNDATTGPNPITSNSFFIRQQYIDFLGREPDPPGFNGWLSILANCPQSGKDAQGNFCDRIEVSSDFFRSPEFQNRGYFIYRFYTVLGRNPSHPFYTEFMPDFAKVSGFLTDQQLEANKVAYVTEFMARTEFQTKYGSLTDPTAYVDALLNAVGLPNHPTRQTWITALTNQTMTRAQVLRALIESAEVYQKFYNEAFVVMQYFGYLRRDPDILYLNWLDTLNKTGDYRTMINGFMNSNEYVQRFGP